MNSQTLHSEDRILREAERREIEARDFYDHLLPYTHVAEVRELLELLKGEEDKHLELIRKMTAKLSLGANPLRL